MRVVDLFAGCGGLSLGFERAGFDVIAAFESWSTALAVYRLNHGAPAVDADLSNIEQSINLIRPYNPSIIVGGPPCQDFSHAGKRNEGERADLTIAFAKIVSAIRPLWFVMENVDRARSSTAFNSALQIFNAAGYGLTVHVLDASYCGVPQKRKRLFCIGKLGADDGFLEMSLKRRMDPKPMTMRKYLGDDLDIEYYYRHPRNYSRRAIFSVDEPAPTVRGVNRPIPSNYKRHPGDPADPNLLRPLTSLERARLQTFPATYHWVGTKTDIEQLIGNAVPVELATFVARCIMEYKGEPSLFPPEHVLDCETIGEVSGLARTIN